MVPQLSSSNGYSTAQRDYHFEDGSEELEQYKYQMPQEVTHSAVQSAMFDANARRLPQPKVSGPRPVGRPVPVLPS